MMNWGHLAYKIIVRTIIGMAMIYSLNYFFAAENIDLQVGYNGVSLLTCAALGSPGVGLLYGITLYENL